MSADNATALVPTITSRTRFRSWMLRHENWIGALSYALYAAGIGMNAAIPLGLAGLALTPMLVLSNAPYYLSHKLGQTELEAGDLEAARRTLARRVESSTGLKQAMALESLARILLRLGRFADAHRVYK